MKFIQQRLELATARRAKRRALRRLGASLPPSPRIQAVFARIEDLERAVPQSLERDRADWALVPVWARWLVALRGVLERLVLRALRHRVRADRAAACEELGDASLESAEGEAARAAREAHARVAAAHESLRPLHPAVSEARHLGGAVFSELKGKIVPRVPGLAGMTVGWWIAQTFTDSQWSARLHGWGFGSGARHAVSKDTLRMMGFWLPLLAAALCSYLGTRLSNFVEDRYGAPPAERQP
jgi:chorismate mutase